MRRLIPLLFLLTACAGGPVGNPAPLAPATVEEGAIAGADGTRLALSAWRATRPRAVILALHGFGDYGPSTFDAAARAWAAEGITTYTIDQRGFGRNASRRAWPGVDLLISDAITVATALKARHPDLPLTVVGHSMGAGIALAASPRGLPADRLVLAGPAIAGGSAVNPLWRAGGWGIALVVPDRRFTGEGLVRIQPTDNIPKLRAVTEDPVHFADPSARELLGLIRVLDRASAAAPVVTTPTLTLIGAKDEIVRPDDIAAVHTRIPGAVGLTEYPDGWHWLFRDLQAPRVWTDVAGFALTGSPP